MMPMMAIMLRSVWVKNRARSAPTLAAGRLEIMVMGWM